MKERRRFRKGEEGMALIYVTLVLVMTMIIIPPLLGFIGGAGRSAQIREDRMLQVYAADAGIEDGYYRIIGNSTQLPQDPEDPPFAGNIPDINGYDVDIEVYREAGNVFKIVSTAEDEFGGNVIIESWAAALDYSYLLDNALSSYGDLTLRPGVEVYGNVTYNGEIDNKGEVYGNETMGVPGWPTAQELKDEYWGQVQSQPLYGSSVIDVVCDMETGLPIKREGSLDIYSSNTTIPTLTITDTVYVTGDLLIGKAGKDFMLDLNGQTIFSEAEIDIGKWCTITGSGCIIAVGDVRFSPQVISGEDDFVFVMSVCGYLLALPQGEFYGSMAGNIEIDYQPGSTITWRPYDHLDLNFPTGSVTPGIRAYIIRN